MSDAQLGARLARIRAQIEARALKCGRLPQEVTLIAISKTHPASLVRTAIELGATDIGENRVQE
ncbi:MAG TPA: YggS family pyridoxal phosphate-dependent enzyme, partial [Pyrinomonadaceae bacterium]|nr:YggS family pyridoxal phosphate-dependent enzyme [Pyrinomonadaceae bacterium]